MSLSRTIAGLKRGRQAFAHGFPGTAAPAPSTSPRLRELKLPFDNPGNLRALCYVPDGPSPPRGLLVVLHGCTQQAAPYDIGSGWSLLAERHGFALLYPEQKRENNSNLCFNWYQASDAARGSGEAASIAAMVKAMSAAHGIAPAQTFVTGLSAGGAMTAVMLATYSDLFAGGAVIAGLPYGCADSVAEAFECMGGRLPTNPEVLAGKVRRASSHSGDWPRLSVWHGTADRIVAPGNADALIAQWTALHGLALKPDHVEQVDGQRRDVWIGRDGKELIERYLVAGMAHGTPLLPGTDAGQSGQAGAHMLDVGLSSTDRIAEFFGLIPVGAAQRVAGTGVHAEAKPHAIPADVIAAGSVQDTIERALRSAGLMR